MQCLTHGTRSWVTRWKGQSFFILLRLQRASLLTVTRCLSIFVCGRQISSCFHILTLILYDFVSKAQLLYFPHHELSCIGVLSSLRPFLIFLKFTLFQFFFLTFHNAERFKSRKIVLKLAVQCKCEEKSPVSGEYMRTPPTIMRMMRTSFWRRLNQFINSKV